MKSFQSFLLFLGRVAMSLMFFYEAYFKITHWVPALRELSSMGIPQTSIVLFLVCICYFLGAIFLVLGFLTRWSAAVLAILLVASTYYYQRDPIQSAAILGGLLYIFVTGPGQFAFDKK